MVTLRIFISRLLFNLAKKVAIKPKRRQVQGIRLTDEQIVKVWYRNPALAMRLGLPVRPYLECEHKRIMGI
jgi:hypothetical protein